MDNTYISVAKETLLAAMEEYYASLDNHDIGQMDAQLKEAIELKNKAEKARDLAEEQLASTRKDLEIAKANAVTKTTVHNTELDIQIGQLKQQLTLAEQHSAALKEQLKVYETSESLADYPMAAIIVRKIVESVVNSGITIANAENFIVQYTAAIETARAKKVTELTQSAPASEVMTEQSRLTGMPVTQLNEQPPKITPSEQVLRLPPMSDEQFNSLFGFDLTDVDNT